MVNILFVVLVFCTVLMSLRQWVQTLFFAARPSRHLTAWYWAHFTTTAALITATICVLVLGVV